MGGNRSVKYSNVFKTGKTDLIENSDVKINVKIMNPMRFFVEKGKKLQVQTAPSGRYIV